MCRAVAAALFGDATKVKYTPLNAKERFTALQSGEIDVLSRNTTWTSSRDSALGLNFTGVNYYDGQGFMAKKALGVNSALELDGASVCVQPGTTTELNLADYFRANNMKYNPVVYENNDEVNKAYEAGRCDVLTTDQSGLYATRVKLAKPDDHVILPEVISKEPLGPAVRQGDDEWDDVVRWTLFAMIQAEEFGLTAANVDQVKGETQNPDIQRFLGVIEEKGKELGLPNDFAVQIIKQVGNYGESFDRKSAEHAAQDRARPERAVEERRPDVQSAVPLSQLGAGGRSAGPSAAQAWMPRDRAGVDATDESRAADEPTCRSVAFYSDPRVRAIFYQ